MPKTPTGSNANAVDMAKAILGQWKVLSARLVGADAVSGIDDNGQIVLSANPDVEDQRTTYLEIEFIPDSPILDLFFDLEVDEIPIDGLEKLLQDGVSVWANGEALSHGPKPPASVAQPLYPAPPVGDRRGDLTISMQSRVGLVPGRSNTLRIATSVLGTAGVLSALMVRSAQAGEIIANDDTVTITLQTTLTINLTGNDVAPGNSPVYINAINGQEVDIGDTIQLESGETILLNDDGSVTITSTSDISSIQFEYTAAFGKGNASKTDDATVTINTVPCFVAGTMIRTKDGQVPVERLKPGQLVRTRDDGLQPIRWIGRRVLKAEGKMAPVRIDRNTFGEHGTVMVSPLHRIFLQNTHAELLFGSCEVLIAARDLIDGRTVRQIEGGMVEYVHLLFDRHQVIWSDDLPSESFLPGPQTSNCFEKDTLAEICEIFPALDPETGQGYGPAARPALRRFEARLLVA